MPVQLEKTQVTEEIKTEDEKVKYSGLWILFFRHGVQANLQKVFHWEGNLESAIKRARDHCTIMGYRYIYLRPLVVDIQNEEDYYRKSGKRLEDS